MTCCAQVLVGKAFKHLSMPCKAAYQINVQNPANAHGEYVHATKIESVRFQVLLEVEFLCICLPNSCGKF